MERSLCRRGNAFFPTVASVEGCVSPREEGATSLDLHVVTCKWPRTSSVADTILLRDTVQIDGIDLVMRGFCARPS